MTSAFRGALVLFFLFSLYADSCAAPQVNSDFYHGLLGKSDTEKLPESVRLFEKALTDSNVYIRRAAASELADLMSAGVTLTAATINRIHREASGLWAAAFEALSDAYIREKVIELFLNHEQGTITDNIKLYILLECARQGVSFSYSELNAVEGHLAVSRLRYNDALRFFRSFLEDGEWPQKIPKLFIEYPVLINDLGRAFQYTSSGTEGLSLFLQWENNLVNDMASGSLSGTDKPDDVRYSLLFYAARIARRIGQNARAVSLFEQALHLAPDTEQSDACIWYILDLSLSSASDFFIKQLEQFIPHWHDGSYFDDVLERFLQTLASNREWEKIISVFSLIRDSGATMKAGYAWIIARVIEEGFLPNKELYFAAEAAGAEPADVLVFKQIAYNTAENNVSSVLYYRSLSAAALGQPFLENNKGTAANRSGRPSPAVQFLLGFFSFNAEGHVLPYIRQLEQELSPEELRAVSQALEQAGMYAQSIQLVSRYIEREGYTANRQDMELLFPQAYKELIEKHAAQTSLPPALLFGLIRTESAFQSGIISSAGAVGLTQLMPATANEMAGRIRRAGGPDYAAEENGPDLSNPDQNIHIGAYYLSYLTDRFEDTLLSLLAYNGGMNRVRRWQAANTLPVDLFLETITFAETRDYGRKVMAAAAVYEVLYY
jgi:soluble lytic murein transglycosylase